MCKWQELKNNIVTNFSGVCFLYIKYRFASFTEKMCFSFKSNQLTQAKPNFLLF